MAPVEFGCIMFVVVLQQPMLTFTCYVLRYFKLESDYA